MPRYRFSAKNLPNGAEAYVLDCQEKGVNLGTQNWAPVDSRIVDAVLEFDLVHKDDVRFRLRLRDLNGVLAKPTYFTVLADRPIPEAVPAPTVVVSQDGPAVLVEPEPEEGHDVEVRTSAPATEAHDALPTPFDPGCCAGHAPLVPDGTLQLVHARLVRRSDGLRGPWTEVEVPVLDGDEWGSLEDHPGSSAFPGTISQQGGKDTLVVTSAGLEPLALPRAFNAANDARAFNATNDRRAFAPHNYATRCVYEADEVVMDAPVDFRLQCFPGSTVTRAPVRAFARTNRFPFRRPRRVERLVEDPEADRRTLAYLGRERRAFNAEEDRDPPSISQEVALTQDGSTWGDYAPVPHGRDIVAKGMRARLVIVPPLGPGQGLVIPSWTVRRRRRNRKYEYRIPFDYVSGDPGLMEFDFDPPPLFMDPSTMTVALGVDDGLPNVSADYATKHFLTPTGLKVRVSMRLATELSTSGGSAAWTFQEEFFAGTTPAVVATVSGASGLANVDVSTPSETGVTVHAKDVDSLAALDTTVYAVAAGVPRTLGKVLHVVLAGF
ncbi:MAG TPA: hypothetical protein VJP77_05555 [Planctomycetota bacterium]|nr:hypothetical protein [Planctomycetota bacterium]